jgi:phytoene synthase
LFALYAFDAEISRVRELAHEPMPAEIRLQWWREVLLGERVSESAANPVAAALKIVIGQPLARERLVDLIEAHRFDIYNEPMPSADELNSYASRTAGAIFEIAARILAGDVAPAIGSISASAANARTIANVLAQLPLHASRRQLFVPLELLTHYQADPEDIFTMRATPALRAALAELRLRARRYLAHVGASAAEIPQSVQPAMLPLAPLRQWLFDMEMADYDPLRPPHVAPWRRQWRIWRAAKSFRRIGA